MSSNKRFDAVLFDFFGTLTTAIQRGPAHDRIAYAIGRSPAEVATLLNATFYRRAAGEFGPAFPATAWLLDQLGIAATEPLVRWTIEARIAAVRADLRLRPDAVPTLTALKMMGYKLAVVSDCGYELPALLAELPVAPLLDVAVYSNEVGACKPDRRMYLTACERLGVIPQRCLYIGDGGSQELEGADRVGMTPVRLAAADLAGHLVFGPNTQWQGAAVASLAEVVGLTLKMSRLVQR